MSLQDQPQRPASPLEEYSRNYGEKLRSALMGASQAMTGVKPIDTNNMSAGMPTALQQRVSALEGGMPPRGGQGAEIATEQTGPMEPGGTADPTIGMEEQGVPSQMEAPAGEPAATSPMEQKKGFTFRDAWKKTPEQARERELTKLEESLRRGNQTIDDAYADLERQLGTAPDKRKKLSREEKGMLLMEFGLNLLANNKKGFGAIGEAGGKALGSYREQTEGPFKDYEATRGAIAGSRARDKIDLAKQSALEGMKSPRDGASRLPGKFTGEDGFVYFYDEMGEVQQAKDASGKPIKAQVDENGAGGRGFEFEAKRNAYIEQYGVDRDGRPLTGLAMQRVQKDALDFATDRGSTLDDLDLDIQAEQSADAFIRSNPLLFEGMSPDELDAKRNEIADRRRKRLRRKDRSYLESEEPGRGRPRPTGKVKRFFNSENDARAAFERGEIAVGDTISVNGVVDEVQ